MAPVARRAAPSQGYKVETRDEAGMVVDFIVVYYWPGKRWPAFNIADAALVAGVLLFMIYLRRHGDPADAPALATPAA